jgi:murein DD-endopeptidase MepM/ murein hydrolase activator NlpD
MPVNTPVLAVADGEVTFAEAETPFLCGDLGMVSALVVILKHTAPDGEIFDTLYAHLNRIDVKKGETVVAGQKLGVSGMTGCTNGAHLHFEVVRMTGTNNGKPVNIDPFGWDLNISDPWEKHADGARSVWLWKEGEAPEGGKRIEEVWGPGILR